MQAKASLLRMRRASTGPGPAWAVYSRLSSELYAVCSHASAAAGNGKWDNWANGLVDASQGEPSVYEAI